MKRRTYLDSGVLIACVRDNPALNRDALSVVSDRDREFVSSVFVRLETLPKAIYYGRLKEQRFYEAFFESVAQWVRLSPYLVDEAIEEATAHGMGALDALHVVSAEKLGAVELITTEKESKPIHRTQRVRVISIARDPD